MAVFSNCKAAQHTDI